MVFLCLGLSVFSTIEDHEYEDVAEAALFHLEVLVVIWFGVEFLVRLWSSGCRSRYQGWIGRLRFMKSPFCIIGTYVHIFPAVRSLLIFELWMIFRCDNCDCFNYRTYVRWPNGGSLGLQRSTILPNITYGSNGPTRWDMETVGICGVCSSTSKLPLHCRTHNIQLKSIY